MLTYIALFAAALLVAADQLIKYLVLENLTMVATLPLIEGVLHLTYVENRGAAFGMFQGQRWILIGLTGVVLVAAIIYLISGKLTDRVMIWGFALIISGGIGNLIDRIFRGFVVDYIDFRLINFYVFNLADACVCIGVGLLILYLIVIEPMQAKRLKEQTEAAEAGDAGEQD